MKRNGREAILHVQKHGEKHGMDGMDGMMELPNGWLYDMMIWI